MCESKFPKLPHCEANIRNFYSVQRCLLYKKLGLYEDVCLRYETVTQKTLKAKFCVSLNESFKHLLPWKFIRTLTVEKWGMKFCVLIFLLFTVGLYQVNKSNHYLTLLKSDSMVPTLRRGDMILARKMTNYYVKDIVILKVNEYNRKLNVDCCVCTN